MIIIRTAGRGKGLPFFLAVFFLFSLPLSAQDRTIPLLISEHHADHLEFFLYHSVHNDSAHSGPVMIVLDAHADTVKNEQSDLISSLAVMQNFSHIGELAGNHDWIHPLASFALRELVWISTIRGYPRNGKLTGFQRNLASWNERVRAYSLSIEELRFREITAGKIFISVDLDFFYSEDHSPQDVSAVLDALFAFSSRLPCQAVWAFCLSRPWLPSDEYAWTLLEQALRWLNSRPEFRAPAITVFDSRRVDTSRKAQTLRAEGREMPILREADAPAHIKSLIRELEQRK